MNECIFCKIAGGEIPAKIVYEDDKVLAFEDINKAAKVHILVIPKTHMNSVLDIDENNKEIIADIHLAVNNIAKKCGIDKTGFRLINNCGSDASQTVKHLHYHILGGEHLGIELNCRKNG